MESNINTKQSWFKSRTFRLAAFVCLTVAVIVTFWLLTNKQEATASWWPLARRANGPEGTITGI